MSEHELIQDLKTLVSFNSVSVKGDNEAPFGRGVKDALKATLDICKKYGFETEMCGNYCGYAQIGKGDKLIGILTHLDVVPPGKGWNTDPFDLNESEGKLFGRGVIDDKGPTIAAIHAVKELLEENGEPNKRIRLLFGCSEENGNWEDIEYYKANYEHPDYGFTPDADFPVVYGEMGIAHVLLCTNLKQSGILEITGGNAPNMVPDYAECKITQNGKVTKVSAKGKSAHGSMPYLGDNAIGNLMEKLDCPLANEYNKYIGKTTDGSLLGCNFCDEESGALTLNPGVIKTNGTDIEIILDIRCPVTYSKEGLTDAISSKLLDSIFDVKLISWEPAVYNDKDGELVSALMKAYKKVSGRDDLPMTMGGGTYARALKNIVAFGPVFPGRECTEHQANEYIIKSDLFLAKDIYKHALENLLEIEV